MAELSVSRNRRAVPKVDLTAMVDLAFLLITFFMLTTSLSKPVAMDISKPDETIEDIQQPIAASRSMTILLGKDNKIAWYMGESGKSQPVIVGFAGIRQAIIDNKKRVFAANSIESKKELFVIIKPTSGSNYKNLVDIMDELHVTELSLAPAIDDDHITSSESDFLKRNNL